MSPKVLDSKPVTLIFLSLFSYRCMQSNVMINYCGIRRPSPEVIGICFQHGPESYGI